MAIKNFGIDLSAHNVIDDYDRLLAHDEGGRRIKFAFLRLGYKGKRDALVDAHYAGLHGRIPLGFYVYSYARTPAEARSEALWAIEQLDGMTAEFPIVFDYEDASVLTPRLTRAEYTAVCKAFLDEVREAGYYAMLYCNPAFLEGCADKDELLKYPLWLAHYVEDGRQRQYGQRVWQFGTIRPEGARGAVDANFAYEQLGRVIREQGLNSPAKVVLRAQKTVTAGAAAALTEELEGRGFRVSARKI